MTGVDALVAQVADLIGPLDSTEYKINDVDKDFFLATISPDEEVVRQRILYIQKKAYKECPYACIKIFLFVSLQMKEHPTYREVLEEGRKSTALFLDLGCCMGVDVRNLVYEGYPESQVVGSDLLKPYISFGHELFNDKDTSKIKFIAADIFDLPSTISSSPPSNVDNANVLQLDDLAGSVTFIYTGSVFHLFDAPKQKAFAIRLLRLWTREPGAIIFGQHQTRIEERYLFKGHPEWNAYAHTPESWKEMWNEAMEEIEGEGAGERIIVETELRQVSIPDWKWDTLTLLWTVRRV